MYALTSARDERSARDEWSAPPSHGDQAHLSGRLGTVACPFPRSCSKTTTDGYDPAGINLILPGTTKARARNCRAHSPYPGGARMVPWAAIPQCPVARA